MRTSHRVLLALGAFLVAFITAMTVCFWRLGAVPDSLVRCTLGAGGVEALLLAAIKVSKELSGRKSGREEA